jgi:hypothetical protein
MSVGTMHRKKSTFVMRELQRSAAAYFIKTQKLVPCPVIGPL